MPDPFEPQAPAVTPSAIGALRIILRIPRGGDGSDTAAEYVFEVLDQNGEPIRAREGNLAPHLTTAEKQNVANFMDALLMKAVASLPA